VPRGAVSHLHHHHRVFVGCRASYTLQQLRRRSERGAWRERTAACWWGGVYGPCVCVRWPTVHRGEQQGAWWAGCTPVRAAQQFSRAARQGDEAEDSDEVLAVLRQEVAGLTGVQPHGAVLPVLRMKKEALPSNPARTPTCRVQRGLKNTLTHIVCVYARTLLHPAQCNVHQHWFYLLPCL
jgi:hypothetical protein